MLCKYNFKYSSMRRLFIGFFVVLCLFSCSRSLIVRQINTENVVITEQNSPVDSIIQSFIQPYSDSLEYEMSKVIAVSDSPLKRDKPESNLTNLISDMLFAVGKEYCISTKLMISPDASYVNYGGLRGSLPMGNITIGNMFELMPFENEVVLLNLSGKSIQEMAQKIASRGGEGISGMTLGIRDLKVSTLKIGGKEVVPDASYWLVTSDYLANGGDQMSMLQNPIERINTKLKMRDVYIQAMKDRYQTEGIISIKLDGRIFNE